jgi:hypothetical protein
MQRSNPEFWFKPLASDADRRFDGKVKIFDPVSGVRSDTSQMLARRRTARSRESASGKILAMKLKLSALMSVEI